MNTENIDKSHGFASTWAKGLISLQLSGLDYLSQNFDTFKQHPKTCCPTFQHCHLASANSSAVTADDETPLLLFLLFRYDRWARMHTSSWHCSWPTTETLEVGQRWRTSRQWRDCFFSAGLRQFARWPISVSTLSSQYLYYSWSVNWPLCNKFTVSPYRGCPEK